MDNLNLMQVGKNFSGDGPHFIWAVVIQEDAFQGRNFVDVLAKIFVNRGNIAQMH